MGWAAGIVLFLSVQEPIEVQVESVLSRFGALAQEEQEGARLAEQLTALGGPAVEPLARRLAEDLRDGAASASAEAIQEALEGRSEARMPLQTAFADGATSPAGRIALARALSGLLDQESWRDGLLAIAVDPEVSLPDRRRAAELLVATGDERVLGVLAEMEDLEGADLAAGLREAEERLRRWNEEPRARVETEVRPAPVERRRTPPRKKEEEGVGTVGWVYYGALGAAAAGTVAVLLAHRRKG
jgi:hypothetical protein